MSGAEGKSGVARTLSVGQAARNADSGRAYFLSSLRNAPITKATSATRSNSFFFTAGKLAEVADHRTMAPEPGRERAQKPCDLTPERGVSRRSPG